MAALLDGIAAYGARDAVRDLPPEVLHHARRAVIDWFSALYPGTRMDPARLLVQAHRDELGHGRSSLPGFGTTAFPALAASKIPHATIVPHDPDGTGNVISVPLLLRPADAAGKFVALFVTDARE